jgi:hypothetical protein
MNAKPENKKPRLEAEAAYENAHLVAQDLLDCLRELLQDQPAPGIEEHPIHWGHVGNLSHVNDLLSQAVCFLGGFDEEDM